MRAIAVVCGLLAAGAATAAQVYKSVDAQGRVSYSESPPEGAVQVERIELKDFEPDPAALQSAQQQLEALRLQNDRMQQAREAQARQRREEAEARRARTPAPVVVQVAPPEPEPQVLLVPVPYRQRPHPHGEAPPAPRPEPVPAARKRPHWPNDLDLLAP